MPDKLALFGGAPVVSEGAHTGWPIVTQAEREALGRVLASGVLSGPAAPEADALQREFAQFVGARFALLTHSGTSALEIALSAAGIGPGDEVIVPAYSFVATPLAAVLVGAVPIFADVSPVTGLLNPRAAEAAVSPRTRAILPVHVHGCALDLDPLLDLARRRGLALIEDAAQAHGARYKGKPVGAIGRAGGFSLQSSKNLPAGEGGLFVTNDEALAEAANRVRNFGQGLPLRGALKMGSHRPLDDARALDSTRPGAMLRGNEMMAAFARAQLARLDERTQACAENAERLSRRLAPLEGVAPPEVPEGSTSVHHKYRVRLDPEQADVPLAPVEYRDLMIRALRAEGLEVVLWQGAPLPAQAVFQEHAGAWSLEGGTDARKNYDPRGYPATQRLLDGSVVLFSQSRPLIAQPAALVDRYAEAFARVHRGRASLVDWWRANRPA